MYFKAYKNGKRESIKTVLDILPEQYSTAFEALCEEDKKCLSEIRLREGMPSTFTVGVKSVVAIYNGVPLKSSSEEIMRIIEKACNSSVYSYGDQISKGFIDYGGIRIGVVGTAYRSCDEKADFTSITSLNFRIPCAVTDAAEKMTEYIKEKGIDNSLGVLVISPPNFGKTTFLRALARELSSINGDFKLKVCLADERGELFLKEMFEDCMCDVITGVSKSTCIEIATRTMSPQVIVVDEIGNAKEAKELLDASFGGVYIVASVHGRNLDDVLKKEHISRLCDSGIFKSIYTLNGYNQLFDGSILNIS